jgi:ATP-dependent exoDNAse (exonuclease V) alpha subunit
MISTNLLDMIAYRLSSLGYLGKLLFVGDFFQLPPVQKHQKKGDLFREMLYAFESSAWEKFELEVVELTQMKRTQDVEFTKILQKIRQGLCDAQVVEYMTSLHNNSSVDTIEPTYLFGRNLEVEQTNRMKLDQLDSDETIIFANIDIFGTISEQRVSNWKKMLPVSEQLTLKEGVPILFTVNKWGKFVNGERGILRTIEDEYLIVEKSDEFVRVERHEFDLLDMIVKPDGTVETISLATLSQFPLKLAYAVTIHKSQGMSIDKLICNVDNIFAPSQFYVAISRAVDPKTLKIEFTRGDLSRYLQRVINVDDRVVEYYRRL